MARQSLKRLIKIAIHALYLAGRVALQFVRRGVALLAASAQTSPANDPLNSSIRGGLLNYRTGRFDDGTDPAGIYKPD